MAHLPVLLMAAPALGAWWLVNVARAWAERAPLPPLPSPEHDAGFTVQRFAGDGGCGCRSGASSCATTPTPTRFEIDSPRIRAFEPDGQVTKARPCALANGDGSEVQLFSSAQVLREAEKAQT